MASTSRRRPPAPRRTRSAPCGPRTRPARCRTRDRPRADRRRRRVKIGAERDHHHVTVDFAGIGLDPACVGVDRSDGGPYEAHPGLDDVGIPMHDAVSRPPSEHDVQLGEPEHEALALVDQRHVDAVAQLFGEAWPTAPARQSPPPTPIPSYVPPSGRARSVHTDARHTQPGYAEATCSLDRPEVVELGNSSAGRDLQAPRRSLDQQAARGRFTVAGDPSHVVGQQELMEHLAVGAQDGIVIFGIGEGRGSPRPRVASRPTRPAARIDALVASARGCMV